MKILSWNCNMAFRKKFEIIQDFIPDIAIIQECEDKIHLQEYKEQVNYTDFFWYGNNKNKGVGIFTFGDFKIVKLDHNKDYKYIIPVKITNNIISVVLIAVWTQFVNKNIRESYVVQAARSFIFYGDLLNNENVIIVGDFNSNAIWDNKSPKEYTHSQMVEMLKRQNFQSLYHHMAKEDHGKETSPTLYFQRNSRKPYHVDYCFCKSSMIKRIKEFKIGAYTDYIHKSDHMPMFIEIDSPIQE